MKVSVATWKVARHTHLITLLFVATVTELEKHALDLPENQRAVLATHLLGSLPSVLHDEDEGVAEALRRDAELGEDVLSFHNSGTGSPAGESA